MGRELITRDECRAIQAQLTDDVESQRLMPVSLDLDRVLLDAGDLPRLHTSRFHARSLDLLQVPAARVASCTSFVSADDRQLAVAKAAGLAAVDIKRRLKRPRS